MRFATKKIVLQLMKQRITKIVRVRIVFLFTQIRKYILFIFYYYSISYSNIFKKSIQKFFNWKKQIDLSHLRILQ